MIISSIRRITIKRALLIRLMIKLEETCLVFINAFVIAENIRILLNIPLSRLEKSWMRQT